MLDALVLAIGRFPKTVPMPAAGGPAMGKLVPPSPGTWGLFVGFLCQNLQMRQSEGQQGLFYFFGLGSAI